MKTIINYIKRFPRLIYLSRFNYFINKKSPRLTEQAIDELIETNKDTLSQLGDEADYDGMGNYGRFPPQKNDLRR